MATPRPRSRAEQIAESLKHQKSLRGTSRGQTKERSWDNGTLAKMDYLAEQRSDYASKIAQQHNLQTGERTYHQRRRVNGKRVYDTQAITVKVDKRKANQRIKRLFDSAYDMKEKARREKKRISSKKYADAKRKGQASMHGLSDDERGERAKSASQNKGRFGSGWGRTDDRLNIRPTWNRVLLSNEDLTGNLSIRRAMKAVGSGDLKSKDAKNFLNKKIRQQSKTRSQLSLDVKDADSLFGKLLARRPGQELPQLEIILFNDAARGPSRKEEMAGNHEGVVYARFLEYGFVRKITRYNPKSQQLETQSQSWVPGKNYLARLAVRLPSLFEREIVPNATALLTLLSEDGQKTKMTYARMLGAFAQLVTDDLKQQSGQDYGFDSHFANSWGWFVAERK